MSDTEKSFTLIFPFDHHPPNLPDDADPFGWGYYGQGRNGAFKAAGARLDCRTNPIGVTEVSLRNITSKGFPANHAVVMPPDAFDQMAVRWLAASGRTGLIKKMLAGLPVQTAALLPAEGGNPEIPSGIYGAISSQYNIGPVVGIAIHFGEYGTFITTEIEELFDRSKFLLGWPS